ncbi:hypothetical protein HCN44_004689 [Aphidius gifuensis]|uniref:alkaline phosphatase n=1 Tax=Aphidius gifuensis TaxID=684658 RepID=A0A834XZP2_APHGI|nr:hypothetical protein HCN44_004689 [Aphidius gifuensis]
MAAAKLLAIESNKKASQIEEQLKDPTNIREKQLKDVENQLKLCQKKSEKSREAWRKHEQDSETLNLEIKDLENSIKTGQEKLQKAEEQLNSLNEKSVNFNELLEQTKLNVTSLSIIDDTKSESIDTSNKLKINDETSLKSILIRDDDSKYSSKYKTERKLSSMEELDETSDMDLTDSRESVLPLANKSDGTSESDMDLTDPFNGVLISESKDVTSPINTVNQSVIKDSEKKVRFIDQYNESIDNVDEKNKSLINNTNDEDEDDYFDDKLQSFESSLLRFPVVEDTIPIDLPAKRGEPGDFDFDNKFDANDDKQVPDSAATSTAIFSGVKNRYKVIGLDGKAVLDTCDKSTIEERKLTTVADWAQATGMDTAALYAHVNNRDWECDSNIPREHKNCAKDIARQLIEDAPGNHFKVSQHIFFKLKI